MKIRSLVIGLLTLCTLTETNGTDDSEENSLKVSGYPWDKDVAVDERIHIHFNRDVVSFRTPRYVDGEVLVDIEPTLPCKWEWISSDWLRCSLPEATKLEPSTRYEITVKSGLVTPNGQTLEEDYVHVFETVVPTIKRARLHSWVSRDKPIVNVSFDQSVEFNSLEDRVILLDSVTGREIPTSVLPYTWPLRQALVNDYFGRKQEYLNFDSRDSVLDSEDTQGDQVFVLPRESLSRSAKISLVLLPGVKGARGELKTTERKLTETFIELFKDFRFLGLLCYESIDVSHFLEAGQSHDATCNIDLEFSLVFSSPVENDVINEFVHTFPQTARDDRFVLVDTDFHRSGITGVKYRIRTDFKPGTTYKLFVATTDDPDSTSPIKDGFGQPIVGPTEVTFQTANEPALILLTSPSITVNSYGQFDPKIYLQNVDELILKYSTLDELGVQLNQTRDISGPKQENILQPHALDLRTKLRTPSGSMFGKIVGQNRFEPSKKQLKKHFFAQATPYSVFFKLGAVSSLAWVVNLETSEPVSHADVELYVGTPTDFSDIGESIFSGTTDKDGLVSLPGYESFDPNADRIENVTIRDCTDDVDCWGHFLRVEGEAGLALLPLYEDYWMEGWGPIDSIYANVEHWMTTSQEIYRPGETVHIKGYVRSKRGELQIIPKDYHFALCIEHYFDDIEIAPIYLNQFGAYHTSFKLRERSSIGLDEYEVKLVYDPEKPIIDPCSHTKSSYSTSEKATSTPGVFIASGGWFQVRDFPINPIQVLLDLDAETYHRGESMTITTSSNLHSGGPHANAFGNLMIVLYPREPPLVLDVDGDWLYEFSGRDFVSDRYQSVFGSRIEQKFKLNEAGTHSLLLDSLDRDIYYGKFVLTGSVFSDHGMSANTHVIASYYGVDQFVGIQKPKSWELDLRNEQIRVGDDWPIRTLVVSKESQVVSGVEVNVAVFQYDSGSECWDEVHRCKLVSDEEPVFCDFIPTHEARYKVDAQIVDTNGYPHRSSIEVEAVVDLIKPSERPRFVMNGQLKLICDEQLVEIGSSISCGIENYLERSQTLVTIERAGIIDQWLTSIDPSNPVIEFNVLEEYAPHFELSVLTVSSWPLESTPVEAIYGVATEQFTMENPRSIPLEISVSSNLQTYQPEDRVSLSLSTNEQTNSTTPIEYAVAIVDDQLTNYISKESRESVARRIHFSNIYELKERPTGETIFDPTIVSFKPWTNNGVRTFGLIDQLNEFSIAPDPKRLRRLRSSSSFPYSRYPPAILPWSSILVTDPKMRSVEPLIAYWNPSIITSDGNSQLDFVLPDSVAKWNVMVLAASADDRFGFATTSFNTHKNTHIDVVAPHVVTEGDKFQIVASMHNRSERNRRLTVSVNVSGLLAETSKTKLRKRLRFAPNERKSVTFDVQTGQLSDEWFRANHSSVIRVVATLGDRGHTDETDTTIPVRSNRIRVSHNVYGKIEDNLTFIPIKLPLKRQDEYGWLDVTISTNEAINFEKIFRFALNLNALSWEQHLSRAVLAEKYSSMNEEQTKQKYVWLEAEQVINNVLSSAIDFQDRDGGMSRFPDQSCESDPYVSAYTALVFSWLSNAGYEVPEHVSKKLSSYLRDYILESASSAKPSTERSDKDMQVTVGAVAIHALALSEDITEAELTDFSANIDRLDLFGLSQYFLALLSQNSSHPMLATVYEHILNHRSIEESVMRFDERVLPEFSQIFHSNTRTLCSLLNSLTALAKNTSIGVDDRNLQELVNAVVNARGSSSHWLNSQENVFCMNALIEYAEFKGMNIGDLSVSVDVSNTDTEESTQLLKNWGLDEESTVLNIKQRLRSEVFMSRSGVEISRVGDGTAFYDIEFSYLRRTDEESERSSGFDINREYIVLRDEKWQILNPGDHLRRDEIVLVTLLIDNPVKRAFVEIIDPIPGGLKPVEYAYWHDSLFHESSTSANILPTSRWYEEFKDASRNWPDQYEIRGPKSVRSVATELKPNKYYLSWTAQAISVGEFTVPPAQVKRVYRPSVFGQSEPRTLTVEAR